MSTQHHVPGGGYQAARRWVAENGGDIFPTFGSLDWFLRKHRSELIASGALIVARGQRGNMIGPNFMDEAIRILRRESGAFGEDAA